MVWKKPMVPSADGIGRCIGRSIGKPMDRSSTRKQTTKICPFCSEEIPRRKLRSHLRIKHRKNKNVPRCQVCKTVFASPQALEDHLNDKHGKDLPTKDLPKEETVETVLPHQCKICNKSFKSSSGLAHHQSYKHDSKCKYCELIFTCKGRLQVHINTTHLEELKKISSKDKVDKAEQKLKKFLAKELSKLSSKDNVDTHQDKSKEELQLHNHSNFKCAKCELYFKNRLDLAHHQSYKHDSKCKHCELIFTSKGKLRVHITTTHREELKETSSKDKVETHQDNNTQPNKSEEELQHPSFKCAKCELYFSETPNGRAKFQDHIRTHLSLTIKCDLCDIQFNSTL